MMEQTPLPPQPEVSWSHTRVECSKGSIEYHFQNLQVSGKATMAEVIKTPRDASLWSRLLSKPCRLYPHQRWAEERINAFNVRKTSILSTREKAYRVQHGQLAADFQENEAPALVFANKVSALDGVNIAQCMRTGFFLMSTNGINPSRYLPMANTDKLVPDPGRICARLPFGAGTYWNKNYNDL
jgi:hypothetical protein